MSIDRLYVIVPGRYGPELVLTAAWDDSLEEVIRKNSIVGLELNYAKGWTDRKVDFLRGLPHLKSLKVIDWKIASVDEVNLLHELRELQISTYCKTKIDFSGLTHLVHLNLEWRTGCDGLFALPDLRYLFINRLPANKAPLLGKLVQLTRLVAAAMP